MRSETPTDSNTSKPSRTGWRIVAPTRKTVKRLGIAVPAIAVAGAIAASQIHSATGDPAAKPASYQLHAKHPASAAAAPARAGTAAKPVNHAKPQAKDSSAAHSPAPKSSSGVTQRKLEASRARKLPARRARLVCSGTSGMLPANYGQIVAFLTAHGYTRIAAAGIAGNIYQESMGNPESVGTGGGGLIGWTPLPAGFVTGNVAADLHTQLEALLAYNQQWAAYIPALNAASTAAQAAYIYMTYFERPGIPAAYNREAAAQAVAQACRMMA